MELKSGTTMENYIVIQSTICLQLYTQTARKNGMNTDFCNAKMIDLQLNMPTVVANGDIETDAIAIMQNLQSHGQTVLVSIIQTDASIVTIMISPRLNFRIITRTAATTCGTTVAVIANLCYVQSI